MAGKMWLAVVSPAAALGLVACVATTPEVTAGRALYQDFCATCHGGAGKGDGTLAGDWPQPPADLTRISERNGGTFPLAKVMSTIDGYSRSKMHGSTMPEMGPVFQDAPVVLVDTGDGIETPVPRPLLDLADYLRSIQE